MRGKKLDRLIKIETLNQLQRQNSVAEESLRKQEEQFKIQTQIEKEKLAVKDRTDISLKEYTEMKIKIKELQESNDSFKKLFNKLNLWQYIERIDFDSIRVEEWEEPMSCEHKIGISFTIKRG